jgi:hypothetical protein
MSNEELQERVDLLGEVLRRIACDLSVGGYNTLEFDPNRFYDKISWGIGQFAKDYHQLQIDLARKAKKEIFDPLTLDVIKDDQTIP